MKRRFCWGMILAAFLAAGCGGEEHAPPARGAWTFLVYMDGDNDLEQFGVLNMNQMEQVGSTEAVRIVVQFDRAAGGDTSNGDWTGARRFLIEKDNDPQHITSPVLEDLGEVDMAQPDTLRQFLSWATARFPSNRLALVLWNHGAGWRARRGIIFDDTSGSFMTMDALRSGLNVSGVHPDLIAIDASLMAMLEVGYAIRDRTDYIAASEESPPATGYPYAAILAPLVANPAMGAEDLGRVIVQEHVAAYPFQPVTQSLLRTDRLSALAAATDAFGAALLAALPEQRAAFEQARMQSQGYAFSYYRDLASFATSATANIPDPGVLRAAMAVLQALPGENGGPVIAEAHNLPSESGSRGVSIYLPERGQYFAGYGTLLFSRDFPAWNTLARVVAGQ